MQSAELRGSHKQHTVPFIMNIRKLLLISAAILGFVGQAAAQTPDQVTVARVTGKVTAQLPDGSTVDVKAGSLLPQGTTIKTGDKSEVYLVNHGDTTSTIVANSEVSIAEVSTTGSGGSVTKQTTTLDLKSGNIVAKLNPAKKAVNNYSVRTPKGVAAARGTVFTVSYNGANYTIAVVNGTVNVTPVGTSVNDGLTHTMEAGQVALSESGFELGRSYSVAELNSQGRNDLATQLSGILAVAVATVAVAAENNIGGTTAAEVRAVADAVIKADPAAAPAVAALVAVSAPTQSQTIVDSVQQNAPSQSGAVQQVIQQVTPSTTPGTSITVPDAPPITTPQPIDPSTVSRSGE